MFPFFVVEVCIIKFGSIRVFKILSCGSNRKNPAQNVRELKILEQKIQR